MDAIDNLQGTKVQTVKLNKKNYHVSRMVTDKTKYHGDSSYGNSTVAQTQTLLDGRGRRYENVHFCCFIDFSFTFSGCTPIMDPLSFERVKSSSRPQINISPPQRALRDGLKTHGCKKSSQTFPKMKSLTFYQPQEIH